MATRYTQDQRTQRQRGGPNRNDNGDQMTRDAGGRVFDDERSGPRPDYKRDGDGQGDSTLGVVDDDDLFGNPLSAWERDDDDQTRYAQGRFTDDDEDLGLHSH